jgi:CHAT domain-containing protein/tetratricopeptide (TPR) repeat protein
MMMPKKFRYFLLGLLIFFTYTSKPSVPAASIYQKQIEATEKSKLETANTLFYNGKFIEAISLNKEASAIFEKNCEWDLYIQSLINTGKCYRCLKKFDTAGYFFNKAELIAKQKFNSNNIIFSKLYSSYSYLYSDKGEFQRSIILADSSIKICIHNNGINDTSLFSSYIIEGYDYYDLRDYKKSFWFYNNSLRIALLEKNKESPDVVNSLNCLGQLFWINGKYDDAMYYYKRALMYQSYFQMNKAEQLSYTYTWLANLYGQNGNFKEALFMLGKAYSFICNTTNSSTNTIAGNIFVNKAFIYLQIGDYDKAIDNGLKAINILSNEISSNYRLLSYAYNYLGKAYLKTSEDKKAIACFGNCIDLGKKLSHDNDPYYLLQIAKAYEDLGMICKADSVYNFSTLLIKTCSEKNSIALANNYDNYGSFFLKSGKTGMSEELFQKAYVIYFGKFGFYNINTSIALKDMGDAFLAENNYEKALQNYQFALSSRVKKVNKDNIFDNPSANEISADVDILSILSGKAHALYSIYKTDNKNEKYLTFSLQTYKLAVNIIDKLRILYGNTLSSLALSDNQNNTFNGAVEVAAELYKQTGLNKYFNDAFYFAEKNKSVTLLSAIQNNEALKFGKVPSRLQDFERGLQRGIEQYKDLVYEENKSDKPDNKKIDYWNDKLMDLKKQYEALSLYIENNFPDYYKLKFNTTVINVDTLKKHLSANEALIEYVQTNDRFFSFVITKNEQQIYSIPVDSSFSNYINNYMQCINHPDNNNLYCNRFISSASALYKLLIKPSENVTRGKSLIIIPDESLNNIPFESMLYKDAVANKQGYKNLPYLINLSDISYAGSASLLYEKNISFKKATGDLLAFAPGYKTGIAGTSGIDATRGGKVFLPLKNAVEEVQKIKNIMGGDAYIGNTATLRNFMENSAKYDVLHLAMHTLIDDQNPMYSELVFDAGKNDNGLLHTYDLYDMQIKARLIVLSACETGFGKIAKGEGMLCLARGFLYAGCPSLIMTLWKIDDSSGSELMTDFYKYLLQGNSKGAALRQSKLDYINKADEMSSSPYYWAGYINYGNHEPLFEKSTGNSHKTIYILSSLLLSVILLFTFSRNIFQFTCLYSDNFFNILFASDL